MTDAWPWLALGGLGAFHGLNPAMGWLFAVALGLHRQSRTLVYASLLPIAAGHAVSIAAVTGLFLAAGVLVPPGQVRIAAGLILLAWAAYHWRFGHRLRFGMRTGFLGLAAWSFLMATAHGAGVMLWPALMPLCGAGGAGAPAAGGPVATAIAGVGVHTLAMVATTAVAATLVYEWLGVAVLRRAWVNVDLVWSLALAATGLLLTLA
jgi:hypothetical protein